MLKTVSSDLTKLKTNFENLRDEFFIIKSHQDESSHIQRIVNGFQDMAARNNSSASDSMVRERSSLLLSGMEILQKEILRLSGDMSIIKATTALSDSDDEDEDYEDN